MDFRDRRLGHSVGSNLVGIVRWGRVFVQVNKTRNSFIVGLIEFTGDADISSNARFKNYPSRLGFLF
jgi:hypothetical protein